MTDVLNPPVSTASPSGGRAASCRTVHHQFVIVGAGTAGLTVAARLRRAMPGLDVAILDPSDRHYYQPLWTLVGGGEARKETTERSQASLIPAGAKWIQDAVLEFDPEHNSLLTCDGLRVTYDFLVVAAGIQIDWDRIPGLREGLGKDGVCSNYSYQHVDKTWEFIRSFKGGTALFTQPGTPIKCGGAPQKIAYLADDHFRRAGVREKSKVVFASGLPGIFHIPHYAPTLEGVVKRKGIETRFRHELVELRPGKKEAVFQHLDREEQTVIQYDMIHVTPPQSAPDFIKRSPLAAASGWVEVDQHTLRHARFENVFSLGDCCSAPNSKTGAAIRKQAPVVVANLLDALASRPLSSRYNGYASCPLVTGYGKLVMAEFNYEKLPEETFPVDQRRERWSMYMVKKHLLPLMYWHGMLKGRM